MKGLVGFALAAAAVVVTPVVVAHAQTQSQAPAQSKDAKIAEAVQPLPDDLKAGATVVTYDEKTGERTVLRQGTNFVECQPKAKDGFVRCYNKVLAPRRALEAKLR